MTGDRRPGIGRAGATGSGVRHGRRGRGTRDVTFTMRTYVHSQPDALAEAAQSLARVVTIRDNSADG
jgi:hypothetical protein